MAQLVFVKVASLEMSLEKGTTLGVYEIVAPIGAGGMGEVYRARDRKLGRYVAIKVLPEEDSRDKMEEYWRMEMATLNIKNVPD